MDQHELADQYIRQIQEDFRPHMVQGTGVLTLALIRACEDLLKIRKDFEEYKAAILRERKEELARILGCTVDDLTSVLTDDKIERYVNLLKPQDRSGAEQPPVGPDPLADPSAEQDDPVSSVATGDRSDPSTVVRGHEPDDLYHEQWAQELHEQELPDSEGYNEPEVNYYEPPVLPPSPIHCPNCGELVDFIQAGTGESPKLRIFCEHCNYEEER